MKRVKLKLNNGRIILILNSQLKQELFDSNYLVFGEHGLESNKSVLIEEEKEPETKVDRVIAVRDWIEEWRELFPSGSNENGYPYRGDKAACLDKMEKFVAKENCTKSDIFKATKYIIDKAAVNNYLYLPQAHYFIMKNGVSKLREAIEIIKQHTNEESSYEEKI